MFQHDKRDSSNETDYNNDNTTTYITTNYGEEAQRIIYCNPYIKNKELFNVSSFRQKGCNGVNVNTN